MSSDSDQDLTDSRTTTEAHAPLAGYTIRCEPENFPFGLRTSATTVVEHLRLLGASIRAGDSGAALRMRGCDDAPVDVRLTLTGWRDGAPFAELPAQAAGGLMAVHGRANGGPCELGLEYVSAIAGITAVQGVLAATFAQLRGNALGEVDLAAGEAGLLLVAQYLAAATVDEDAEHVEATEEADRYRPPFTSVDGVRFEIETLDPEPWQRFWTALGARDDAIGRSWRPFVLRYARATAPLSPRLHEIISAHTFDHVRAVGRETGVDVLAVRALADRAKDAQPGPAKGNAAPWRITPGLPAAAGARSDEGLPLAGVKVVESTRRVQGPMATRLLTLLGAEVIRVEPPGGDPLRWMPPIAGNCSARFTALNHGKRIVEIDFKTAAGRAEIVELVRDADVFLHNWAPGKAAELGLDAEHLAEANPGLVYAYASGWGDELGPNPPLGTDFMVQAYSGVADLMGGRGSLMTLLDLAGGFVAAEGILAGLVAREHTGRGQRVDTSLLGASTTLLAQPLSGLLGEPWSRAHGGLEAVFHTADGLLAVSASGRTGVAALADATGWTGKDTDALEHLLLAAPADHWARLLRNRDVPAAAVLENLADLPSRFPDSVEHPGCAVVTSPWRFA